MNNFTNDIIFSICSLPIVYIPHYHYAYIDSVIAEAAKAVHLDPRKHIVEYDLQNGLVAFDGKMKIDNANWSLEKVLTGILRGGYCDDINKSKDAEEYSPLFSEERLFVFKNIGDKIKKSDKVQSLLQSFVCKYEQGLFHCIIQRLEDSATNETNNDCPILPREKTKKYSSRHTDLVGPCIIIVSPESASALPPQLEKLITVVDLLPPSEKEIEEIVLSFARKSQKEFPEFRWTSSSIKNLVRTLLGLQRYEIWSVLSSSIVRSNGIINKQTNLFALEEKKRIVKKSGILEVIDTDISLKDVGGLDVLKHDIAIKGLIYKHLDVAQRKDVRLSIPKGILIIGMPGCGKTMIAKAVAKEFGVNLLRLDVNRLMGSYVGESESNFRRALQVAEAAHPCVLWIDEMEKAFAGTNGNSENDALVTRLLGQFLTWMQEKDKPVYVVATANDAMKPELMRKGRFDEVYFVDFPTTKECETIIRTKICKYDETIIKFFDFSDDVIKDIANKLNDKSANILFSGAEIEYLIASVVEDKFAEYIQTFESEIIDLSNDFYKGTITISKEDITNKIKEMEQNLTCKQRRKNQSQPETAIDRIYALKDHFKSASKA